MNVYHSYAKYLLTRRMTKRIVVFVLVTFVYNFFMFPVHAAEATEYTANDASNIAIIKSPDSETKRFERLVAAEPMIAADNRPELAKRFAPVSEPVKNPEITTKKPTTKAKGNFTIASIEMTPEEKNGSHFVTMTAYNSEVAQTDGDPCTTADGFNVCKHNKEDVVAANFLPFGTKIKIPELFGDRVFTVHDRTARKYSNRVDIWFKSRADALQFGKRKAHIIVVE